MGLNRRNSCLDMLKGIGCISVIFIHIPFPEDTEIGKLIFLFTKFAVPCFFMISGYYVYGSSEKVIMHRVKKLIKLLAFALMLYSGYFLITKGRNNEPIINFNNLLRILLFGDFNLIWAGHLWFILALIYIYLIYCIIKNMGKIVYILIPILFTAHIVVSFVVANDVFYYNNFLLSGLPFFLSGHFIAKCEGENKKKINNIFFLLTIATGIIILGLRRFMAIDISYLGTILYSVGLFGFAVKNPDFSTPKFLCILGNKYSTHVYIFHVLFIYILKKNINNKWIAPIMITIITIFFSIAFDKGLSLIGKHLTKNQ